MERDERRRVQVVARQEGMFYYPRTKVDFHTEPRRVLGCLGASTSVRRDGTERDGAGRGVLIRLLASQ